MPSNDNDATRADPSSPSLDAHAQAALLLVESLIHGLCENGILSTSAAIGIAERAIDVQVDHADAEQDAATMWRSHAILSSIAASLRIDEPSPTDSPIAPL